MINTPPVGFIVGCYKGIKLQDVRSELERLILPNQTITWRSEFEKINAFSARTTQQAYESLFSVKLEYVHQKSQPGNPQPYDYDDWEQKGNIIIPSTLSQKIRYVNLDYKLRLA